MKDSLWRDAFDRLISNKLSLFGSIYILFIVTLALITPLIAPYDYAYQDLKDDIQNNIKSTAVLFAKNGKYLVITSYFFMFVMIGYLSFFKAIEIIKLLVFLSIFIYIMINLIRWDHNSEENSGKKFRQNNLFGAMIFLYLLSF